MYWTRKRVPTGPDGYERGLCSCSSFYQNLIP